MVSLRADTDTHVPPNASVVQGAGEHAAGRHRKQQSGETSSGTWQESGQRGSGGSDSHQMWVESWVGKWYRGRTGQQVEEADIFCTC